MTDDGMNKNDKHEVEGSLDDLLFVFGAALRYGLGRRTYATSLISAFLMANTALFNEKWFYNFLTDLKRYEDDREFASTADDECDYQSWMRLKITLIDAYAELLSSGGDRV